MNNELQKKVRVRFAPSPTGYLHIGSLRTALYNFLFARKNNGSFILRIEDTDQTRIVPDAVENLIKILNWVDLDFNEGPFKDGDFGPYIQSQRLDLYKKYAQFLIDNGSAYYCFCSSERLEQVRQKQIAAKLPPAYDRHCRNISLNVALEKIKNEKFVIRMKVPLVGEIEFHDIVRGNIIISFNNIDDQILLKSDGFPTYHLAVVVDDHFMEISHVIRGEEWLSSTPKHLLLYKYFNWKAPIFAHLPLLLNPDRSKLSKRQGDVAVEDYKLKGYLKEALINFVALLGWNPKTTEEFFTLDQLINEFSLENINKSGAVFDINKLNWMNSIYIRKKSAVEILSLIKKDIDANFEQKLNCLKENQILTLIDLFKERAYTLVELEQKIINFDKIPEKYEEAGIKEFIKIETLNYLEKLIHNLEKINEWNEDTLSNSIKQDCKNLNIKLAEITQPIRLALTGTTASAGVFSLLSILSKDESLKRLKIFLNFLKGEKGLI